MAISTSALELQEIFASQIQQVLKDDNSFASYSKDHSEFTIGKVVHLPQAGPGNNVKRNRTSLPATSVQRTDAELTYTLQSYSIDPTPISDLETYAISYNKRASVIDGQMRQIMDVYHKDLLRSWSSTATAFFTSGSASTDLAPGATGTRKAVTISDIRRLQAAMDLDNIPEEGRVLLLEPRMYQQLVSDPNVAQMFQFGTSVTPTGKVTEVAGFTIMKKASTAVFSATASAVRAYDDTGILTGTAVTDSLSALAWHPEFVSRALSPVNVHVQEVAADWYGPIVSANLFGGGAQIYTKGVYALVQGT